MPTTAHAPHAPDARRALADSPARAGASAGRERDVRGGGNGEGEGEGEGKLRDARRQRSATAAGLPAPSAREIYAGLAVLTVLAGVTMMRGGTPVQTMAAAPGADTARSELRESGSVSQLHVEAPSAAAQAHNAPD